MSYSSLILWSLAIVFLEEYFSDEQRKEEEEQNEKEPSTKKQKKKNIQVMHIDLIDKRLFKKRKSCSICYLDFSFFKGQYHCYVCASSVCWDCSSYSINKMRSCDICYYKFENVQREIVKDNITKDLQKTAKLYIKKEEKLRLNERKIIRLIPNDEDQQKRKRTAEQGISQLQLKLKRLKEQHQNLLSQLQSFDH